MASYKITLLDRAIINHLKQYQGPITRLALFIVYFWFGVLKIFGTSPANPLVEALLERTVSSLSFPTFIIFFGLYEMLIGVLWLIPKGERIAIALLIPHLFMIISPLILLPSLTWHGLFIPTLEGQYIIKNVVIIALAMTIGAKLEPFKHHWWQR
ncbi:MAG: hypothetical protein Q7K39_00430 [Candidatus Magasanikbacteria bacterium]|nr:hypothetical protein [Candidatus Magasanikbacteria bacterium]